MIVNLWNFAFTRCFSGVVLSSPPVAEISVKFTILLKWTPYYLLGPTWLYTLNAESFLKSWVRDKALKIFNISFGLLFCRLCVGRVSFLFSPSCFPSAVLLAHLLLLYLHGLNLGTSASKVNVYLQLAFQPGSQELGPCITCVLAWRNLWTNLIPIKLLILVSRYFFDLRLQSYDTNITTPL